MTKPLGWILASNWYDLAAGGQSDVRVMDRGAA